MYNIDYKIFVPRGLNNYIQPIDGKKKFDIEIIKINIDFTLDQVVYYIYFNIPQDDEYHKVLLQKNKKPKMILLIGNNPYEIHGDAEILDTSYHNWEEAIQIRVMFIVKEAHKTVDNPRKEVKYTRSELLDLD